MTELSKGKKIAYNSILLYIRMGIVMIINLFTVRFILKGLGLEDYGIYDVVAGLVSMLAIFGNVLSTAVQRYYSFALGENDYHKLQSIFVTSLKIFSIICLLILVLSESAGLWLVNKRLVIPDNRMLAANYIFQFAIFSLILILIEVPFSAAVIAHENMGIFALISTSECIMKLIVAICIVYSPFDRLIFYGFTLFLIKLGVSLSYILVSKRKYKECSLIKVHDKKLTRELISFSGWIIFSSLAALAINQISAVLINIFFGPTLNGARAISIQVASALGSFVAAFFMAVNPPIVKSYAENDYQYVLKLFNISNKFCYYALLIVLMPLFFEMESVLKIWLNISDKNTVEFARLMVIYAFILALNNPVSIVIRASGYLKQYHVPVECIMMLSAPLTYIVYKLGCPAISNCYILIFVTFIAQIARILILQKYFHLFRIQDYVMKFLLPALLVTIIIAVVSYIIHITILNSLYRFILVLLTSIVLTIILLYGIGLTKIEREMALNYIKTKHFF